MKTEWLQRLPQAFAQEAVREPAQVLYGGAQLFSEETFSKVQRIAEETLAAHAPDAAALTELCGIAVSESVYARVQEKLKTAPLDDYRIDFEDGYGVRPDQEEDGHAAAAAKALSKTKAPPFVGFRIKALTREAGPRALRTLDLFLRDLVPSPLPRVVTLPKVESAAQVHVLCEALEAAEDEYDHQPFGIELMLELPAALEALPALLAAGQGRVTAVHFGAYDFLSALGVSANQQTLDHPLCVTARAQAQFILAGRVRFSDGATTLLPVVPKNTPPNEARALVQRAFHLHTKNVQMAMASGIFQGWDLHPAQLVPRYTAIFSYFSDALSATTARLKRFLDTAAQATVAGGVFDDAATGQGLLNFFARGLALGALTAEDLAPLSLTPKDIAHRSFGEIVAKRPPREP